jgi:hypothetical protein
MFFKKGDILVYSVLIGIFSILIYNIANLEEKRPEKAEIYVNNELKYIYKLQEEQKIIFVDTDIGGVTVEFKDYKVRVTTSFSPKKLCVKQGWISRSGETIIGVPDKLIIKVTGSEEELDYILR